MVIDIYWVLSNVIYRFEYCEYRVVYGGYFILVKIVNKYGVKEVRKLILESDKKKRGDMIKSDW